MPLDSKLTSIDSGKLNKKPGAAFQCIAFPGAGNAVWVIIGVIW